MSTEDNKLRIGLDMDGVLTSFYSGFKKLIKDIHGVDIPEEHPSKWYWCRDYLTRKQEDVIWREVYKSKTFWRELPVCPKLALDDYKRIRELCETDEVFIVTHTVSNDLYQVSYQRLDWLAEYCGLERHKYTLVITDKKIDYINSVGLDFYIDDKPSFLRESSKCLATSIIKMNWEYNEDVDVFGVNNVTEYLNVIQRSKKGVRYDTK